MEKGFTSSELLVVVAILGVLAVVGILSFGGFYSNAKKKIKFFNTFTSSKIY